MPIDTGAGPSPEDMGLTMCEICFSQFHKTEDCDVTREQEMLKNVRWMEELVNGGGLRTEKTEQTEGLTSYKIYDADQLLGSLEIADEQRALADPDTKIKNTFGINSFLFESPNGSTYKTGPSGASSDIADIIGGGIRFLREARAEVESDKKENVKKQFGHLEVQGSNWHESLPSYDRLSDMEKAEVSGVSLEEFRYHDHAGWDIGILLEDVKGKPVQNDLRHLWRVWQKGGQDDDLERKVLESLSEKEGKDLARIKDGMPEVREISKKMEANDKNREQKLFGLSAEDLAFIKQTVDEANAFRFSLSGNNRDIFYDWWEKQSGCPTIHIPSDEPARKRLKLDELSTKELESKFGKNLSPDQQKKLDDLKSSLGRYWQIKEKVTGQTKENK